MADSVIGQDYLRDLGPLKYLKLTAGTYTSGIWVDGGTVYTGIIVQDGDKKAAGEITPIRNNLGAISTKVVTEKGTELTINAIVSTVSPAVPSSLTINKGDIVELSADNSTFVRYMVSDFSITFDNDPKSPVKVALTVMREDSMATVYDA